MARLLVHGGLPEDRALLGLLLVGRLDVPRRGGAHPVHLLRVRVRGRVGVTARVRVRVRARARARARATARG